MSLSISDQFDVCGKIISIIRESTDEFEDSLKVIGLTLSLLIYYNNDITNNDELIKFISDFVKNVDFSILEKYTLN